MKIKPHFSINDWIVGWTWKQTARVELLKETQLGYTGHLCIIPCVSLRITWTTIKPCRHSRCGCTTC